MKLHNVLIRPTDLFEEILRRKLISGGGGAVLQTVTGISPLTLLNVARRGIESLTQFGKCEQASTPTPSVPVDIKCNNGALKMVDDELPSGYKRILGLTFNNNVYYAITGFKMRGSDTLRFSFKCSMSSPACNVLGAYDGSSSQSNYSLYLGNSASAKYLRYNGSTYRSDADSGTQYDVVITPTGSIGMKSDSTWTEKTFESTGDLCIGTTSSTATSSKMVGDIIGNVIVDGRLKLVPCERVSDNTLGYYDTVSEVFYEPTGTGVVSMGYDGSHYGLSIEGTPEVLTICGKNLYNKNYTASEINAFVNSTNNKLTQGTTQYVYVLPCKPNTTYTASGMGERTSRWGSFTSKEIGTVATAYASGNGTITTGANDKYIIGLISAQSQSGDIDFHDTLQIEIGSTATDYEAYLEQTASVTDLFAVGDYKDEQDIISGAVTKSCGIKVLDGTEEWTTDTYGGYRRMVLQEVLNASGDTLSVICSHYVSRSSDARQQPNSIFIAGSGKLVIYVDSSQNITTVDEFNAWLSAQYANGTPVVIVCPLAEPTTEQVTGQHLTAKDTATITAQSEYISGIELEVEYWQKAA